MVWEEEVRMRVGFMIVIVREVYLATDYTDWTDCTDKGIVEWVSGLWFV